MQMNAKIISLIFILLLVANTNAQVPIKQNKVQTFKNPTAPQKIKDSYKRSVWEIEHYWDNTDFTDNNNLEKQEFEPFLRNYVHKLQSVSADSASVFLTQTLQKTKINKLSYTSMLNMLYPLYDDANSVYRDDVCLAAIIREVLTNNDLSDERRQVYNTKLELTLKNSVGILANNIGYIDATGKQDSLYNIQADLTMLIFYSPDCEACDITEDMIKKSEIINNSLNTEKLKILAYAPEAPKTVWEHKKESIPSSWINGYDPDMNVWMKRMYEIKGFPTIYLLDKDKRVILKDVSVQNVESFLDQNANL